MPLTPEAAPEPRDFDALRSLLVPWRPSVGPIVLADQDGKGRAAVAVLSALIMAHYQNTIHLPVPHDTAEMYAILLLDIERLSYVLLAYSSAVTLSSSLLASITWCARCPTARQSSGR